MSEKMHPVGWPSRFGLALAMMSAACRDSHEFVDEGRICIFSEDTGQNGDSPHIYAAGSPLVVVAMSPGCFQSGCFEVKSAECRSSSQGTTLLIESEFIVETIDHLQCKSDCRQAEATCTAVAAVAEGRYRIQFGEEVGELMIPSERPPLCLDSE